MKIKITYEELVGARNALVNISKVEGLSAANKMMIMRVRIALKPDFDAIDTAQRELIEKYIDKGHARLKAEVARRAEGIKDADAKKEALKAADEITRPVGVLQTEMDAYQTEYTKLLFEPVTVEIPTLIPAGLVLGSPVVSADDGFLAMWALDDDVTPPEEKQAQAEAAAQTAPQPQAAAAEPAPVPSPAPAAAPEPAPEPVAEGPAAEAVA